MKNLEWTEQRLADMAREREKYVEVSVQASFGRPKEVVRLLKSAGRDRKAIMERTNNQGRTLLHEAVADGDLAMVRALVGGGKLVDVMGADGTPAMLAAKKGHLEILEFLGSKGANLNIRDEKTNYSMLMVAIHANQPAIALYLIDQKVDFGEQVISKMGWSAVDFAVTMETPDVFFRLIDEGAMAARGGEHPIEVAVKHNCLAMVEACVAHPEYRKPLLQEGFEKILKHAMFGELRQQMLSMRSRALINEAMESTVACSGAERQSMRAAEMSL